MQVGRERSQKKRCAPPDGMCLEGALRAVRGRG